MGTSGISRGSGVQLQARAWGHVSAVNFLFVTFLAVSGDCLSDSEHSAPIPDADGPFSTFPRKRQDSNVSGWNADGKQDSNSTAADGGDDSWMSLGNEVHQHGNTLVVAQDGSGNFRSIQDAVKSIPKRNAEQVLIYVKAGNYWEKVRIHDTQDFITIEGEIDHQKNLLTTIFYNSTASDRVEKNHSLGTFQSATFATDGDRFTARNLVFKNTAPAAKPGADGQQAVAVRVSGDMSAFYGCHFYSSQDTLYDHRGRHFFERCYVEGSVDFIFGNGRSLYKNCHLNVLDLGGIPGYVTAQGVAAVDDHQTGFSFINSAITGEGATYLGRTLANNSRVVFANTFMDKVIVPKGWEDIGMPALNQSVFFAEFNCTGPGAAVAERSEWSRQLNHRQAEQFLSISFVDGWTWLENPDAAEKLGAPAWKHLQKNAN